MAAFSGSAGGIFIWPEAATGHGNCNFVKMLEVAFPASI
jgi:hypothetical protein